MKIAIANLKGGVAKTTSAVYLAEVAAAYGPTLLVDCDPQGSALAWSADSLDGLSAVGVGGATRTIGRDLDRIAAGYEHVIMDTPPGDGDRAIVRSAISAADVVIIPLTPSALEIARLGPTLDLAAEGGAPAIALLVKCRATRSLAEAAEGLRVAQVPTFAAQIKLREEITGSYGTRPTVFHGYDQVWAELKGAVSG